MDLSTRNLEQALSIRRQIDALERRLRGLVDGTGGGGAAKAAPAWRGGKRQLSAGARAKIAAAARARWARFRAGRGGGGAKAKKSGGKRGGGITAAGRRRLSQLMKARWAARRKAKRK
jgi:hypothetical protein